MDEQLRRLETQYAASQDEQDLLRLQHARKASGLCPDCGVKPRPDHTHCLKCQPEYVIWDTFSMVTSQAEMLREDEPELTEDEAFNQANQYDYEHEWEYAASTIGEWVEELNPHEYNWLRESQYEDDWREVNNTGARWYDRSVGQATPGTEAYYLAIGNRFLSIASVDDRNFKVAYDGESLIIDDHTKLVPGIPCEECDEPHPTQEKADNCCHLCEICDEPHKTEEEAKNCCFVCPHCETVDGYGRVGPTIYGTKEEMENCDCESDRRNPTQNLRCAYCHGSLKGGSQCGCGAKYHKDCFRELGVCATIGCENKPKSFWDKLLDVDIPFTSIYARRRGVRRKPRRYRPWF